MTDATLRTLTPGGAISDGDLFLSRQGANTTDTSVTGTQIKSYATSNLPAANLSGTTLATNVVNSSLTSVGTLTSLNVTGAVSASNVSGTNTGDVTLTAVGSSPSANGASLSGQVLTLQPADATHPGLLTAADYVAFSAALPASLTSSHIFVGNVSNVATDVAMTGDVHINNTGVTSLITCDGGAP